MSVLAVSYSGLLGGAERILLDVATRLPEPPLLACPDGPLASAARAQGIGVFELSARSLELRRSPRDRVAMPLRIAAQAAEAREVVAGQRPDAVLAWGMRAALVLGAAYPRSRGRPPWLFQHHDLLPGPRIAQAVRLAAARADAITAISRCVARDLDPDRLLPVEILPFGVDLDRFRPLGSDAAERPREVLVLGAIERWKRPDLALEAVALAARELPDLRVRLLGAPIGEDGERLLAELRRRAEGPDLAGRVELGSSLADPRPALQRAACLLHCSDREPYGMVVAEALASGLPVVAPDSCGPAEIVDERCAALYPPGDAAAAAAALTQVLGDEATTRALAKAARARAEQALDVNDTCARLAATIGRLRTGSRPKLRSGAFVSEVSNSAAPTKGGVVAPSRAGVSEVSDSAAPTKGGVVAPSRASASEVSDSVVSTDGGVAAGPRPTPSVAAERRRGSSLAIVTVVHQSETELAALLASIERFLPAAQVVVVDSGSSDGGPALARAWRDGAADLIALPGNLGFGRGVNAGMAVVRRPVTALLNPDVELLDASLEAATREFEHRPTDVLAPLVLRPAEGCGRQDSAQRAPGAPALLLHALLPGSLLPRRLAAAIEPWRAVGPRGVGWAVGCALVGRTDLLRRLGPFDERAFMYGEDLDLGLRTADAGFQTTFWPAARLVHHGAHSTHDAFGGEPLSLLARRRDAVVAERRGPLRARADRLFQATTFADRLMLKALGRRSTERERGQLEALRGLGAGDARHAAERERAHG